MNMPDGEQEKRSLDRLQEPVCIRPNLTSSMKIQMKESMKVLVGVHIQKELYTVILYS